MSEVKPKRPRGRPEIEPDDRKVRVDLFLSRTLAAFLLAEDVPEPERKPVALRRKREFAARAERAEIDSRII